MLGEFKLRILKQCPAQTEGSDQYSNEEVNAAIK